MKINAGKTKTMVMIKAKDIPLVNLKINNNPIEQVKKFKYLGSTLTSDGRCSAEISQRITMAKRAVIQKRQLISNKKFNIKIRTNFSKCYVWRVLLYDCEIRTINKQDKKKLEAMEMWTLRRLL